MRAVWRPGWTGWEKLEPAEQTELRRVKPNARPQRPQPPNPLRDCTHRPHQQQVGDDHARAAAVQRRWTYTGPDERPPRPTRPPPATRPRSGRSRPAPGATDTLPAPDLLGNSPGQLEDAGPPAFSLGADSRRRMTVGTPSLGRLADILPKRQGIEQEVGANSSQPERDPPVDRYSIRGPAPAYAAASRTNDTAA